MWPFSTQYPDRSAQDVDAKTFDYIIVGGGTAGCVLASRLSEDPSVSVLVLEKGHVWDTWLSRVPIASEDYRRPESQAVLRQTEPIPTAYDRRIWVWGAEALGGTSRINGKLVTRCLPAGYDEWAAMGRKGWGWDDVEPYFKKSENATSLPGATYRGHDGPWQNLRNAPSFLIYTFLLKAADALGFTNEDDMNDPKAPPRGMFVTDYCIDDKGNRASTYRAFLSKEIALERQAHLTICTGVIVTKLDIDVDAGLVKGVYVRSTAKGAAKECYVSARREVIICNGALCSPQLLMLSGIGPEQHLDSHKIPVKKALPGVGANLKDHVAIPFSIIVPPHESLQRFSTSPLLALWQIIIWLFWGGGLLGTACHPLSLMYRTTDIDPQTMKVRKPAQDNHNQEEKDFDDPREPENIPDTEVMLFGFHGVDEPTPSGLGLFSMHTTLVQPASTGRVELASLDPAANPRIFYPMFTDTRDFITARTAARLTLHLQEQLLATGYPHGAPFFTAPGMQPDGTSRGWRDISDEEIDEYVKRKATSSLHLSCTCRMAPEAEGGVVDDKLRVHGFKNLRVADASVLPKIPSAHTMAPVVMLAERCAEFVKTTWAKQ